MRKQTKTTGWSIAVLIANLGPQRPHARESSIRSTAAKHITTIALLAVNILWACAAPGQGILLFHHSGDTDPLAEGSSLSLYKGSVGPLSGSTPSWSTSVPSNGLYARYSLDIPAAELAPLNGSPWVLSTTVRIDSDDGTGANTIFFAGLFGYYEFSFGLEGQDPWVGILGTKYVLRGAGHTFNTYQVVFDPTSVSADVWVNGVDRIRNVPGSTIDNRNGTLDWGSGLQRGPAQADWSSITLTVVPEPSIWSIGVAAAALACRQTRRGPRT